MPNQDEVSMMSPMPARGASIEVRSRGGTAPASPAAVRAGHPRWRDPRLVVGIAVVAVCTLLGARLVGGADDTVGVWSARAALSAGEPVVAADLVRREVRFADQDAADAYLSADSPLPSGARLARAVGAGRAGAARRPGRGRLGLADRGAAVRGCRRGALDGAGGHASWTSG